jgi:ribosomal protein L7/L12
MTAVSWYVIAAVIVVVLLVLVGRRGEGPASARGLAVPPTPERIDEYLRAGRKVDAIKAYRALHHVDLKTAKDAVDARADELGR